jgi:hypothetical protein
MGYRVSRPGGLKLKIEDIPGRDCGARFIVLLPVFSRQCAKARNRELKSPRHAESVCHPGVPSFIAIGGPKAHGNSF